MTRKVYKGIPREKIPWYPTINYDKCVCCVKCVDYCKLGVFGTIKKYGKKEPLVSNPNNCVVLCKGCQDICPSDAISHQSRKDTIDLIRKLLTKNRKKN